MPSPVVTVVPYGASRSSGDVVVGSTIIGSVIIGGVVTSKVMTQEGRP